MTEPLQNKKIVLGVSGSISCYKSIDLASRLVKAGALVDVVLSDAAQEFVTPLAFQSITHRNVISNLFEYSSENPLEHITLAREADVIVLAPATANSIAKLANGFADNAISAICMATTAPILIAPAMDGNMYHNKAVQKNIDILIEHGVHFVGPNAGRLASGLIGLGRLVEPEIITEHIKIVLGLTGDLKGMQIVVSAGGTQEAIDPVRVITNRSSGKMGYAIAEAARDRGGEVTLVTASSLPEPPGIKCLHVMSVAEMREAVLDSCNGADALIMAAAVSDYRPAEIANQKIKKKKGEENNISLDLVKNDDFFLEVPTGVMRIGFAAETEDLLSNAEIKLNSKGLSFIAANDVTQPDSGFNVDTNRVTLIDNNGKVEALPLLSKYEVGNSILDKMLEMSK